MDSGDDILNPEPDEFDMCHHGIGFDEECENCEDEMEEEQAWLRKSKS